METKLPSLGSSLSVPCVQDLAKEPHTSLPQRYVHHDQENPVMSDRNNSLPQLPVVDMQKLLCEEFMDSELDKLDHACKDLGFFQLINHQVSPSMVEKIKVELQKFFMLPTEEKKKYWQQPGDLEGFGNSFVVSEEQKLDWGDMFFLTTLPTHLRKPHLFPNLPLSFREILEAYSAELKNLAMKILNAMAKALGMEPNDMTELFEEGWQSMRMNYYPPCPQPDLTIGLSPHSDSGGLTILLQVNEMEGLQIKKDGMWVPVKPLPNAFVINIGDILEIVTNGTYRSIEHRAAVNSTKERLSIATFYSPKLDGDMGPAPRLITSETPQLFRRVVVEDYFKQLFARKRDKKSSLDRLRIDNGKAKASQIEKNNMVM